MANNNGAEGVLASIGCVILLGKLAFWGFILYAIYHVVFNVLPAAPA